MTSLFPQKFLLEPVSGKGSQYVSGRFNVKGANEHRVTYLAMHPHVSMREFRYTAAPPRDGEADYAPAIAVPPVVLFSVTFNLKRVLDLTNKDVRQGLGIKPSDLSGHWWKDNDEGQDSDTQNLSRIVFNTNNFDAIKYESTRTASSGPSPLNLICYAVFPDRLQNGASLKVEGPNKGMTRKHIYSLP